ncbi:uncharacterized protein LOC106660967 [Cimex lectularius]|uniref:DUF4485 domain-containing protein n=1 Tax=Cimex lectularius TaxID=79782 RepID=A0A8I6R606_CIMLE|nr:uncharacterized protein LOC106660967 [Cimex lectularius]
MTDKEFDFLYEFAKKLVMKLVSYKEKALGSQWLNFLKNTKSELRTNYLKVFIVCAHKQKLNGLFAEPPPTDLSQLKESPNLYEFGKKYLLTHYNTLQCDTPIVSTLSGDRKEYAAAQVIPNLGVQMYYTTSETPLEAVHD